MIVSNRTREIVKTAAIERIACHCDKAQATQLYDKIMDKIAIGNVINVPGMSGVPNTSGSNPAQPNTYNAVPPPQVQTQTMGPPSPPGQPQAQSPAGGGALKVNTEQMGLIEGAQEFQGAQPQPQEQGKGEDQVPMQPPVTNPMNPNYMRQIPTNMSVAADALRPQASDKQLMICKAAAVIQCAKRGLHSDVALWLLNNQLNKCAAELIKTAQELTPSGYNSKVHKPIVRQVTKKNPNMPGWQRAELVKKKIGPYDNKSNKAKLQNPISNIAYGTQAAQFSRENN